MFGCTDPVQVLLHVVCQCEDYQLSVLSPLNAVLGVSQYRQCNLLPWPHLHSSCLLAAFIRHVHTDEQGPWASFIWCFSESVERPLVFGSLNKHGKQCLNPIQRRSVELFGFLQIIFERQGPEKGRFFFAVSHIYKSMWTPLPKVDSAISATAVADRCIKWVTQPCNLRR